MNTDNVLSFVIVGHVDHGKSTLIGRLLYDTGTLNPDKIEEMKKMSSQQGRDTEFAYLLDHLEEERKQGITIDTTQVFFKTDKRRYVIIDAPGHVEFVKNMITGASQAEAAILIIDANEGVKEQTKRHSYMLSMLGLKQVIVVVNKMDLVDHSEDKFNSICKDAGEFLGSIDVSPTMYIPMAALKGDNIANRSANMGWYKGLTFLESLDTLENSKPASDKPLMLPVQDVYKIDDKRINAGRIEAGELASGEKVKILPGGFKTKIKSIEKFLENPQQATAGECIGFITEDSLFLDRGDIVCRENKEPTITDTFTARVFWMSRKPLQAGERLLLRCATQEQKCSIEQISRRINSSTLELIEENAKSLENLEVAEVTIKTKKPICIKDFNEVQEMGRFVMVRDENIVAGGIIRTSK
ncbi:MAG: sulfate adenylyltransferase subunit 1 [Sedimentisphaeraceae bacterium JB056]